MEINYELNVEDIVALQRHLLAKRSKKPLMQWWMNLIFALPLCALLWLRYWLKLSRAGESEYPYLEIFITFIVLLPTLVRFYLKWWVGANPLRNTSKSDQEKLFCPRRLILTPESLRLATYYSKATYYWDGIDCVGVTAGHIFIFTTSTVAHVVPRRVFSDDRGFQEFAEAAKQYLLTAREEARRGPSASKRIGSSAWQEEASKHFQSTADGERLRADDTEYRP